MQRYLVELSFPGKINLPDDLHIRESFLINTLSENLREMEFISISPDHGFEIDNHDDGLIPVTRDETIFEVRGIFDSELPEDIYMETERQLQESKANVTNIYTTEKDNFTRVVVEVFLK